MPDWIAKYWIEWIFGILCAVLAGLYKNLSARLKRQKEEQDALKNGIRALLQRQISEDGNLYCRQKYSTIEQKNTFLCMYDSYHALGGNGAMTNLRDRVMALPNEPENAA
ncbi:MAG: hypothetical protein IKI84_03090 [Clostridia bacterium]|nr:hypothetical protein [Clostridia bacterium]